MLFKIDGISKSKFFLKTFLFLLITFLAYTLGSIAPLFKGIIPVSLILIAGICLGFLIIFVIFIL